MLTPLLAVFLENPAHTDPVAHRQGYSASRIAQQDHGYHAGLVLVAIECAIYLVLAALAWRRTTWAFWPSLVIFGFAGLGVIWVPLRPEAHQGLNTMTIALHAFVTDLPGLLLAAWLLVGLVRYGHPWASRSQPTRRRNDE